MQVALITSYVLGALVMLSLEIHTVRHGAPEEQRGGGIPAMVLVTLLWPVLAIMLMICLLLFVVDWISGEL